VDADRAPGELRRDRRERLLLVDAVLPARETDRRKGADDQEHCRQEPHRTRIGTGSDNLDGRVTRRPSGKALAKSNRRLVVTQLKDRQKQFLDQNPYVGVVTTLREDGSPHSTIVWVDVEDGKPSFNTAAGRAKPKHLEHDPRASLLVVDPNDAYKWVAVSGRAQVTEDGADAQIDKLAKKYIGKDEYPWRKPTEQRLKVLIEPEKVDASGFDG
jgi:PPOX class probable F420-dependent enzyme